MSTAYQSSSSLTTAQRAALLAFERAAKLSNNAMQQGQAIRAVLGFNAVYARFYQVLRKVTWSKSQGAHLLICHHVRDQHHGNVLSGALYHAQTR